MRTVARVHPLREVDDRTNITPSWVFKRVVATVDRCSATTIVEKVFAQRAGAVRVLHARPFLVALFSTPLLGKEMHLTQITATIHGWTPSQRHEVELPATAAVSYKMVADALQKLTETLAASDEHGWDAGDLAQACLDASLKGHPPTSAVAIDGTDISTWAKLRYSSPLVDADTDGTDVPDSDAAPIDPAHPHTPRQGRRLPKAPLGSDGRAVYSADVTARMGWRSAKFDQSPYYLGYEEHAVTDAPTESGQIGPTVPLVTRALNVVPAGTHRGKAGLIAIERAKILSNHCEVLCDRAYNNTRPETFALPLIRAGAQLIVDLSTQQRGRHPGPVSGTVWIDGTLFSSCVPEGLIALPPITRDMSAAELDRAQELRQKRQPWAFVPHGARRPDGSRRYRGPAVPPAHVRSPKSPRSMRLGYRAPTGHCDKVDDCGCAKTVTLYDEDFPNVRMPFQYGSAAWSQSYHRRVHIEALFGDLKSNQMHVRRGYFRVFGLANHQLLLGFVHAAMNLVALRSWFRKRELHDPWDDNPATTPTPNHRPHVRRRTHRVDGVAPDN